MRTLETDIELGADGSLRLLSPLPAWLQPGRNHVLLVMNEAGLTQTSPGHVDGIEKNERVCGGDACIAGTRIPVWTLAQSRRLGFTNEELLDAYPGLDQRALSSAWAYEAAHQAEIDQAIRENEEA